jgi:hypothetical protein
MRSGRRWIVLDADFFANHFTDRILERFGPAGVCLFVALLCAAKRGRIQGQITYASDAEAVDILGLRNLPLVNSAGDKWTLDDFWKFTGTQKQTSRSTRGRVKNVKVTGWSQWQETLTREKAAERMRRLRAESMRTDSEQETHAKGTGKGHDNDLDFDPDQDTPPTPPRGSSGRFASNGKSQPTARPVPEWKPEPQPEAIVDPANAIGALRTEHGWGNTKAGNDA